MKEPEIIKEVDRLISNMNISTEGLLAYSRELHMNPSFKDSKDELLLIEYILKTKSRGKIIFEKEELPKSKPKFEELWKEFASGFSWTKVYRTILALEWSWYERKTGMNHIPTKDVIFEKAKELCKEAYDKECEIGTGGLYAKYEHDNLTLRFEIESNTYPIF